MRPSASSHRKGNATLKSATTQPSTSPHLMGNVLSVTAHPLTMLGMGPPPPRSLLKHPGAKTHQHPHEHRFISFKVSGRQRWQTERALISFTNTATGQTLHRSTGLQTELSQRGPSVTPSSVQLEIEINNSLPPFRMEQTTLSRARDMVSKVTPFYVVKSRRALSSFGLH